MEGVSWRTVRMMMSDQVTYKSPGKNGKKASTPKVAVKSKEDLLKKIKANAKNWE